MALISVSNNALQNITAVPASVPTGALVLLSTQTASSSASLSFTSGIDSTYDSYVFKFIDINPATDLVDFEFQASTDGGSSYGVTTTNATFRARHDEADTTATLDYNTTDDLAQSTAFINLSVGASIGNGSDESEAGTLQVFNPSSSTFVKHYISTTNLYHGSDRSIQSFNSGYFNTTSPIDAFKFQVSSGSFDGIIKMYGVK